MTTPAEFGHTHPEFRLEGHDSKSCTLCRAAVHRAECRACRRGFTNDSLAELFREHPEYIE